MHMNRPAWQRWAAGIAVGALITLVGGFVFGFFDLEVGRGFLGRAIPILVCGVAGSVAVRVARP